MNKNTKLEVALEVIAAKIARASNENRKDIIEDLIKERQQMYDGNEEVIDKIINVYGPEIKNNFKEAQK